MSAQNLVNLINDRLGKTCPILLKFAVLTLTNKGILLVVFHQTPERLREVGYGGLFEFPNWECSNVLFREVATIPDGHKPEKNSELFRSAPIA